MRIKQIREELSYRLDTAKLSSLRRENKFDAYPYELRNFLDKQKPASVYDQEAEKVEMIDHSLAWVEKRPKILSMDETVRLMALIKFMLPQGKYDQALASPLASVLEDTKLDVRGVEEMLAIFINFLGEYTTSIGRRNAAIKEQYDGEYALLLRHGAERSYKKER